MTAASPRPTEIRLTKDRRTLVVSFEDGVRHEFAAEFLRVMSPSAEVQGHSPGERKTVGGKRDVEILGVEPVGNYAVRLDFDDLHSSGIYTFAHLHELGRDHDVLWARYLDELVAKGLQREKAPA